MELVSVSSCRTASLTAGGGVCECVCVWTVCPHRDLVWMLLSNLLHLLTTVSCNKHTHAHTRETKFLSSVFYCYTAPWWLTILTTHDHRRLCSNTFFLKLRAKTNRKVIHARTHAFQLAFAVVVCPILSEHDLSPLCTPTPGQGS